MEEPEHLSEADLELIRGIVERTKADNAREAVQIALRLDAARALARDLASSLSGYPQVRRVFFFGSASTGRDFRLDSDIDLAVEGGDILSHRALVEVAPIPVDVVDFLALPPLLREGIESEGELLYEKR